MVCEPTLELSAPKFSGRTNPDLLLSLKWKEAEGGAGGMHDKPQPIGKLSRAGRTYPASSV